MIDVFSIIVYIPSTFCPTLGHHQGRIYYKSDVTFVFALLLCKISFLDVLIDTNNDDNCRNFVKELVILFHRTAVAPWGHVASIIKKSYTGDSSSIFHSHRY